LAEVEGRIAVLEAELETGDVPSIARALRAREDRKRDLATRLADARARATHPVAESWGEARSLLSALDGAPDPEEARLRLRSALRRIVSEAWLLVVPKGLARLAAVQIHFKGDGRRDYLVFHRPPHHCFGGRKEGALRAWSLADVASPADLDLRKRKDARDLEKLLAGIDLEALANV
jgi:hypothetical protein